MAFTEKLLRFTFKLGQGSFDNSGFNTVTLEGLRATALLSVNASSVSTPGAVHAVATVFGMTLSQINQLTFAGLQYVVKPGVDLNQMTVEANDGLTGYQIVFSGTILEATPKFNQPQSPFVVSAYSVNEMQLKPIVPNTFAGPTDVAQIMQALAQTAGLTLENNNVNVKLASPYFWGGVVEQIASCARAANISWHIDTVAKVLAIWPKTGFRQGSDVMVSPATGMIGYPEFQQAFVHVRTYFNTALKVGIRMQIQSQLTAANGAYIISQADHFLSSKLPDGDWYTDVQGIPVTFASSTS